MNSIWIIRFLVFLSAFLLFQIEFIIGKILLPNFGGSFMVWGACIVFFQAALLLGYMYAHYVIQWLGIARYRKFHLLLLILPALFFPGKALALKYASLEWPMVIEVFWRLALSIGPVFFVLSTMSIICQSWISQSTLSERNNPYVLFSVSNFGSFLALVSYPFIFEMVFDLNVQQHIWRAGYCFVVLLYLLCLKFVWVQQQTREKALLGGLVWTTTKVWIWFFYGVAGVMMFLSVTNLVTEEIAPVPLFWMIPLVIYLLSYVLNFKKNPWCPRWINRAMFAVIAFSILFYFAMAREVIPMLVSLIVLLFLLLIICLFCQSRLYALRPDARQLTFYYFVVSLGGFCGGLIATWIAPLISSSHLEYFLALFFVCLAWLLESPKISFSWMNLLSVVGFIAALYFGPKFSEQFGQAGLLGWAFCAGFFIFLIRKDRLALVVGLLASTILLQTIEPLWFKSKYVFSRRNYYGIKRVFEEHGVRLLTNGNTVHGAQFIDPKISYVPLTYYNPKSPVAEWLIHESNIRRVGMIGLGTGALATYLKKGQQVDLFELDPDIVSIAQEYFTYLDISQGEKKFIVGDARLSLEKMDPQNYQILVVDAFSGDSVPVHLLTVEAIKIYQRHLTKDGIVILHLTNRYMNLPLAFMMTASSTDAYMAFKQDNDYISKRYNSDWVALTWDKDTYEKLLSKYQWNTVSVEQHGLQRPWSDAYSNIIPYFLNLKALKALLKERS
ncbi:MAG: fused MFS/spermidine synthase [Candidatus Omnitrophota bacterium]